MKLDRELQHKILKELSNHYIDLPRQIVLDEMTGDEQDAYITNLRYLDEHGLVASGLERDYSGKCLNPGSSITAAGLDFLADDGGLSAILGVVTVRLHDETIRDLIEMRVQESDLPAEEKTGLIAQLRALRGESIKHLTMKLLDAGLANLPAAIPIIQKALGGLL